MGYAKQPASGDASVYAYGTDHVIRSARRREECYPYNRVAVFGTAAYGESVVWAEVDAGGDRLQEIVDAQLDTAAKCTNRAAAVVRDWDMAATPVWIQAPVNCGVEMYDVVTVTESAIELAAAKRRVRGYVIRYRCSGGHPQQWDMDLALGGA